MWNAIYQHNVVCALRLLLLERSFFANKREKKFTTLSLKHPRDAGHSAASSNCKLEIIKHRWTLLYMAYIIGIIRLTFVVLFAVIIAHDSYTYTGGKTRIFSDKEHEGGNNVCQMFGLLQRLSGRRRWYFDWIDRIGFCVLWFLGQADFMNEFMIYWCWELRGRLGGQWA